MVRLSHSALGTYKQCQLKYRFQYIDKLPAPFDQTVYTLLGNAVHKALEFLYKQVSNYTTPSVDQVQQVAKTFWKENTHALLDPVAPELEEAFLMRAEAYIDRYYKTYTPFNQTRPWGFEMRVGYKLDEDTTFGGIIDRLDSQGDTLYINDYKTNQKLNADDHDSHEEQLTLYGLAAQQAYGNKFSRIVGRLIYLHLEKEYEIEMTQERMNTLRISIAEIVGEIKTKTLQYNKGLGNTEAFTYTVNDNCQYCPFQMACPAWKHKYAQDEMVASELGEHTIKHMIDEYGALQKQIKALDDQKKSLGMVLTNYAQSKDETRFFGEQYMLNTRKYEKLVCEDPLGLLHRIQELHLEEQYLKPADTVLLKDAKTGAIPSPLRDLIKIDSKKILMGTRPLNGEVEDEDDE